MAPAAVLAAKSGLAEAEVAESIGRSGSCPGMTRRGPAETVETRQTTAARSATRSMHCCKSSMTLQFAPGPLQRR
jgi:hypothetical protein